MTDFQTAIQDARLTPPPDIVADGHIHRFDVDGDKPHSKNGWYVLFNDPPAGAFGDWKRDIKQTWSATEYKALSPEEKARHKANMEAVKHARKAEQARIHAECREQCAAIWEQAQPAPADHPYLVKKDIKPYGLKVYEGALLVPVRDGTTLHGVQFINADGTKRFKSGTDKRGKYCPIGGQPITVLYLAEGFATAASIHKATREPVAVCFDAGNLTPVAEVLREKLPSVNLVICGDNDAATNGNPGQTKAIEAARAVGGKVAIVQMPEGTEGTDFNDLAAVAGLDAVREQIAGAVYPTTKKDQAEHPEPLPLPDELLPVEPFDYDLLPETFRPWVQDICERIQCPPDFVAVAVMAALGAVVGRKICIRPQSRTSWTETPNMWAMIIGRPGVMKSPALDEAMKPLDRLIAKALEEFKEVEKEYKIAAATAEYTKEANKKKIKAELAKPVPGDISAFIEEGEIEEPQPKRYRANDTSYQALGELLRHNPNGLLVFRDELVSLLKGLDREDQSEARGFYLTAWNGNSPYTFDRIGRGMNLHIPAICLSMMGGTQPGKISEYVRHAVKGGSGDDGLIQRFGLMVWPDIPAKWENVDRWPDNEAKNAAFRVFDQLDNLDPVSIGAEQDTDIDGEPDGIPYLRFSPEGQALFLGWRETVEPVWRGGDLPDALTSHFTKYRKLVPALALLLHLAEGDSGPVSETAVIKALAWGEYLESHARRVYGSLTHHEVTAAKAIITKIKQGKLEREFSGKDVWRPGWSKLADRKQVECALQLLVDYQWLFEGVKTDTGGRPATRYTVNPGVV